MQGERRMTSPLKQNGEKGCKIGHFNQCPLKGGWMLVILREQMDELWRRGLFITG